jgi:methionine aminotransferase
VRALITPRTRMIIINSPHNPSGSVWSAQDMAMLEALVRDSKIVVVSDEVYEHVVFDQEPGRRHESVTRYPGLRERSFVVSSFGKTYHVTGWKVAYCLAPRALMHRVSQGAPVHRVHRASPLATGAGRLHARAAGIRRRLAAFYQAKRDFFRQQLAGSRFELLPCAGTYFQLATYAAISDEPDTRFVQRLTREFGVAAIPVSVFNPDGEDRRVIRFCFAKNEATLAAAGERLRERSVAPCRHAPTLPSIPQGDTVCAYLRGDIYRLRILTRGYRPCVPQETYPTRGYRLCASGADIKKARCLWHRA